MNAELIEKLKTTWTAFGGLSKEEQEFLRDHEDFARHMSGTGMMIGGFPPLGTTDGWVIRLSPDYEEPKRWFFNPQSHTINSIKTDECCNWDFLVSDGIVIEVKERDLPYLEKPEGEWELVKNALYSQCYGQHNGFLFIADLNGDTYRWCKPRKTGRWEEINVTSFSVEQDWEIIFIDDDLAEVVAVTFPFKARFWVENKEEER